MIVNVGRDQIRNSITGDSITYPTHMAMGTGTTAATLADTTLEAEVDRNALDSTTKSAVGQVTLQATWAAGDANGNTLTEVASLNAAAAGDMYQRKVFAGVAKTASFALVVKVITRLKQANIG